VLGWPTLRGGCGGVVRTIQALHELGRGDGVSLRCGGEDGVMVVHKLFAQRHLEVGVSLPYRRSAVKAGSRLQGLGGSGKEELPARQVVL